MMAAAAAAVRAHTWNVATRDATSIEWSTPPAIYRALDQEFDFTLDAAAGEQNALHVHHFTKDTDALAASWARERVFCNPPYGRGMDAWLRKGFLEASEHGALVVMLLPARTGNRWFHDLVLPNAEIRFIRGRLGYALRAGARQSRAPFDSMVVIFRPGCRGQGTAREQYLFPFMPKVVGIEVVP